MKELRDEFAKTILESTIKTENKILEDHSPEQIALVVYEIASHLENCSKMSQQQIKERIEEIRQQEI